MKLRHPFRAGLALCLALGLPLSTWARPSLLDLESDLGQVVGGLCGGDPAQCGAAPVPAVAGQLDFDGGTYALDFRTLHFAFSRPSGGVLSFESLTVTADTAGSAALLSADLLAGKSYAVLDVVVPDPSGPGSTTLLSLQDAVLTSLDLASSGTLATLVLQFQGATTSWMGVSSSWSTVTGTGSGCTAPSGEQHVALAGNPPSLLGVGEVEAEYGLSLTPPPAAPGFGYTRSPVLTSACYLRTAGSGSTVADDFHRLSSLSATFATQLREESVEISSASITGYALSIEGSAFSETVTLGSVSGQLVTRTFSPLDGSLAGQTQTPF